MDLRCIIGRMNKLNIMHRILIHRLAMKNDMYFGQFPILEYVKRNNMCTQKDIADFLQISPPSIATSIKRMQKTGFLEKLCDENDLRCNRITITQKGIESYETCRNDFNAIDENLFKGFSEEERKTMYDYFGRMLENLSSDEFKDKTTFSLIAEEKLIHEQIKKKALHSMEESKNDSSSVKNILR